jgi:hypothetical protein
VKSQRQFAGVFTMSFAQFDFGGLLAAPARELQCLAGQAPEREIPLSSIR